MMNNLTQRLFSDEQDYEAMRHLLRTIYADDDIAAYCTLGDLDWWRYTTNDPEVMSKVALWFNDAQLVAFAWPGKHQIDLIVHPDARHGETEMIAWAEERCWREEPDAAKFTVWSFERDGGRNTALSQHGYSCSDEYMNFHTYPLIDLPAPMLPPDYAIRHVAGVADLIERVAVHRAAFAPSRMTVEKHRAVMQAPTYRPELDLVVTASNGNFVAYTTIWFDEANRFGLFEPVGCHPDHQRKGFARAVMFEGMRRLAAMGATTAHVISSEDTSAGAQLYRAMCFRVMDRIFAWEKLRP